MVLADYLLTAMIAWVPLSAHAPEPADHAMARYASIAADAASVVYDPDESPLFDGEDARAHTAVLMLAVASFESFFNARVDDGRKRGDHGASWCLMQVHVGAGITQEGWTGPELTQDRRRCFRAGLHIMQASLARCRNLPADDRLSAYAAGYCFSRASVSRTRVQRARAWWERAAWNEETTQ